MHFVLTGLAAFGSTNTLFLRRIVFMKKVARQQNYQEIEQEEYGNTPQQVFSELFHFYKVKQKIKIAKFGL